MHSSNSTLELTKLQPSPALKITKSGLGTLSVNHVEVLALFGEGGPVAFTATNGANLPANRIGTVTFAVYMLGSGRNYDYDSSETVGTFVATRSLLDPFRRQDVFNNHPLLSFVDHLVYSAGLHGPTALRVLPVLFAAGAVALVAGWATRCWGALAGTCAGAMLAANPLFAFSSRGVRGYSLVTLSAVASTLLPVVASPALGPVGRTLRHCGGGRRRDAPVRAASPGGAGGGAAGSGRVRPTLGRAARRRDRSRRARVCRHWCADGRVGAA